MNNDENAGNPASIEGYPAEEHTDPLDVLAVLVRYKRWLVGIPLVVGVLSIVLVLVMSKSYLGTTRLLPVQQNQSMAMALLSQVGGGGLASLAGSAIGTRSLADLYVGILKSRTIADAMIARFKLQDLYETETLVDTRLYLESKVSFSAGREGIIVVEVEDKDPTRAADMANAYGEELQKLNQGLAITEAGVRRGFFELQLKQVKDNLAEAEVQLRGVQQKTGLLKLDDQGRAIIEAVASMRAQIAVKEVQLASMRSYATDDNPDYRRMREELAALRSQLEQLEKTSSSRTPNVLVPTGAIPELAMDYIRKLRDVKYYEVMFELMAKQFELARLDEAKDAVVVQIIDKAAPPDKKHKPRRTLIVVFLTALSFCFAVVLVFVREGFGRLMADPTRAGKLRSMKKQLQDWR